MVLVAGVLVVCYVLIVLFAFLLFGYGLILFGVLFDVA